MLITSGTHFSTHAQKNDIHRQYQEATSESEHRCVARSTYHNLWLQLLPCIVCSRPMTDLCWECQRNNRDISSSSNQPDVVKQVQTEDAAGALRPSFHGAHLLPEHGRGCQGCLQCSWLPSLGPNPLVLRSVIVLFRMSTFHSWWETRGARFLSLLTFGRPSSSHSPNQSKASNSFTTFLLSSSQRGGDGNHTNTASFSRGCRGCPPCPSLPGPVSVGVWARSRGPRSGPAVGARGPIGRGPLVRDHWRWAERPGD